MASKASDIYRRHSDYYDEETRDLLAKSETPLDYPNQIITNDVQDLQAIARAPRPYMIVASNGMLTGGRVVGHLRNLIDDPAAVLLFVGYQGVGTLGAHLQAGAKTVKIDGQVRQVRCQIRSISGFSAHADESELLDWLGNLPMARTGRPGLPACRVPGPRRSGCPGGAPAEGSGARVRGDDPAVASGGGARLEPVMWSGPAAPRLRSFHASGLMSLRRRATGAPTGTGRGSGRWTGRPALEEGPSSAGSSVSAAELMQ